MGPTGLDLGIFLANFLWYYSGHSEPSRRRGAVSGVMAVIDSYRSAFRVQLGSGTGSKGGQNLRQTSQSVAVPVAVAVDVEEILNEVGCDLSYHLYYCAQWVTLCRMERAVSLCQRIRWRCAVWGQ